MMKKRTICLVVCCDTKQPETDYVCQQIELRGFSSLVIDTSTSSGHISNTHIMREEVAIAGGKEWTDVAGGLKHELLDLMCAGVRVLARELYDKNKIDGIFSFGGLQNTTIAKNAMLDLPIGFPKMIVSTVATGQRTFDQIVDVKDITVMPAISDFSGINSVSTTILQNGVAAICGMASNGIRVIPTSRNAIIGTTVMGATNDGVANAVKLLMEKGMEVVSFHSTGAGGRAMEDLIGQNIITAAMDLTLHEVVYEYFGYGFGFGANNRLVEGVRKEIPMVVCPAGIDFMCQWKNSLFEDIDTRKYNWHNSDLAHVKLKTNEVIDISNIIIDRLNRSVKDNIVVIMPMKGFRSFTRKGEVLHDEEVDLAIIDTFRKGLKKEIPIKSINANFMDEEFSVFAANEMMRIL